MNPNLQFLRQRIEHENHLANQRLSALVGSKAFLVSAFAISLNAPEKFHAVHYGKLHRQLTQILPVIGMANAMVMMISLLGAMVALQTLYQQSARHTTPDEPPVHSPRFIRWMGHSALIFVPVIFLLFWTYLIITSHRSH